MAFDPDAYLKNQQTSFNPDQYLGTKSDSFDADSYLAPPSVEEINKAAFEKIEEYVPQGVKAVGSAISDTAKSAWNALPSSVQDPAKTTGNFLLDVVEKLSRPFQAVSGSIKEQEKIKAEKKVEAVGQDVKKPKNMFQLLTSAKPKDQEQFQEQSSRLREASLRGFKGEEKFFMQEMFDPQWRRENPVKAMLLGFAMDVVVDPLKASVVAAPYKVTKEAVGKLADVAIPSRLTDNDLFRLFNINKGDVAKAQELFNQYRYLRDKASSEGIANAKTLEKQIKILAKDSGMPVNELKAKIFQDIETGNLSSGQIGALEQKIVDRNRKLLEQQQAAGIDIGDLGETYMPHLKTEELDSWLRSQGRARKTTTESPSAKNPQAIQRKIDGTVAEINAKNIYGTDKFFRDDPAIAMGVTEYNTARAIAGKKFLEDAQQLGVKADEAPAGWRHLEGIPGYKFDPAVAGRIEGSYKMLTNQKEMRKFLNMYDGALNWWKMWTLGARPAYHAKNVMGNLWNAYLGGVDNPTRFAEASLLQAKILRNQLDGNVNGIPAKELYEEMRKRGIVREGQYSGDIVRGIEDQLKGGSRNPLTLSTRNPILQAGFRIGQELEDNARIALFLDQLKRGKSYDEAGRQVQKYLFDYGDLSPFEQNVMKRIIPFYTWSRKNIPLQLQAIVEHPDKISKFNLARENIQLDANVPDYGDVPEYATEGMPIYLPEALGGQAQGSGDVSAITLGNFFPLSDLGVFTKFLNKSDYPGVIVTNRPSDGISDATSMMSPYIKTIGELLGNYDLFRKRNIEEFKGQTTDFLGVTMPVWSAKVLSNIVMLSEMDRANPYGIFGTRYKDPDTGEIKSTKGLFGQEREARIDLPEDQRLTQYLTGLRILDINMDEAEYKKMQRFERDVKMLKGYIRRAGRNSKDREIIQAERALETFLEEFDRLEQARAERKARRAQ
jgi:hypothetical protein